jgi:hypothetical protein
VGVTIYIVCAACTSWLWICGPCPFIHSCDESIALLLAPVSGIPECGRTLSEGIDIPSQAPSIHLSHVIKTLLFVAQDECIALFLGPVSGFTERGHILSERNNIPSHCPTAHLSHVVLGRYSILPSSGMSGVQLKCASPGMIS